MHADATSCRQVQAGLSSPKVYLKEQIEEIKRTSFSRPPSLSPPPPPWHFVSTPPSHEQH
jgi:hypothetical protein